MLSRRSMMALGLLVLGALMMPAFLPAQERGIPPFNITADRLHSVIKPRPGESLFLSYEGNVQFTSPRNNTRLSCQRLKTNADSLRKVTAIEARGKVSFSTEVEGDEKGKPGRLVQGTAELMQYTMTPDKPTVRLVKENGVDPRLSVTNLLEKDEPPMVITGEEIELNLLTWELTGKKVRMGTDGGAR